MHVVVGLRQLVVNATNPTARLCSKGEAPQKEVAAELYIVVSVRSVLKPCAVPAGAARFEGSHAHRPLCLSPPAAQCYPKLIPRKTISNHCQFHVSLLLNGHAQVVWLVDADEAASAGCAQDHESIATIVVLRIMHLLVCSDCSHAEHQAGSHGLVSVCIAHISGSQRLLEAA
jgi:hypothetical protein